jgi:6-phosphogluconolactonase (cycloisomerase 2 family)
MILALSGCGGGGGGAPAPTPLSSAKAITSFSISNPAVSGTINESAKTIALTVPSGTAVTALVSNFATTGASMTVNSVAQVTGTTANDFTLPLVYTVIAADGSTSQYTVTVTVAGISTKAITSFSLLGVPGVINETAKTISLVLPSNSVVTSRAAVFTTSGASVKVGTTSQVSGTTTNNFSTPVIYTVTAANGTSTTYTVTVSLTGGLYLKLQSHTVSVDLPSVITFFYQALDINNNYVTSLTNQDFTILEDGLPLSPAESFQELVPITQLPYVLKTVLLIDVSSSISPADLVNMKAAAKNMVANMTPQQQIAVYTLDDRFTQVSTFTKNKTTLNAAIDSIVIGNPSTDFYGAIVKGVALWTDTVAPTGVTQGYLVAITDGADNASVSTIAAANTARGNKSVYTIGAGAYADTAALTSIGNAGYLPITDFTLLQNALNQVAADVAAKAASYYFMRYATPKRAGTHTLSLQVAGNTNTTSSATIPGSFNAAGFSSITRLTNFAITPSPGNILLGVNQTQFTATGTLANGSTTDLSATSIWSSSDTSVATMSAGGLASGLTLGGSTTVMATAPATNMFKFAYATASVIDVPPTVPTNLAVSAGGTAASLSWGVSTDNIAVDSYRIYRDSVLIGTTTATSYRDAGLLNSTNYCYTVSAFDTSNNESVQSAQTCSMTLAVNQQFAYFLSQYSSTVFVNTINPLTGALTAGATVAAGTNPTSVAVDPTGKFVYVANSSSDNVSVYTSNPLTGALTAGATVAAGTGPGSITVDPTGKFVYVANYFSNDISVYTINPFTGALTAGATVAAGTGPGSITVDPTGKFAYVANASSNNVSVYTINPLTGALTVGATVAAGNTPYSVKVDPTGKFAYVANLSSGSVSTYTINPLTGALTAGATVTVGALSYPVFVTVDPQGKFAYVAIHDSNNIQNNVSTYIINPSTGALTAGAKMVMGINSFPDLVTVDPTGKFAYVAISGASNNISTYTINPLTGALTAGAKLGMIFTPTSIVVTPPM